MPNNDFCLNKVSHINGTQYRVENNTHSKTLSLIFILLSLTALKNRPQESGKNNQKISPEILTKLLSRRLWHFLSQCIYSSHVRLQE